MPCNCLISVKVFEALEIRGCLMKKLNEQITGNKLKDITEEESNRSKNICYMFFPQEAQQSNCCFHEEVGRLDSVNIQNKGVKRR